MRNELSRYKCWVGGIPYSENQENTHFIGNDYIYKNELISSICDYDDSDNLLVRMDMLFSIGVVDRALAKARIGKVVKKPHLF